MAKPTKPKSPLQKLSATVKDISAAKLPPVPRYPVTGSAKKKTKAQKMR